MDAGADEGEADVVGELCRGEWALVLIFGEKWRDTGKGSTIVAPLDNIVMLGLVQRLWECLLAR